jgi:hypothetical protein
MFPQVLGPGQPGVGVLQQPESHGLAGPNNCFRPALWYFILPRDKDFTGISAVQACIFKNRHGLDPPSDSFFYTKLSSFFMVLI